MSTRASHMLIDVDHGRVLESCANYDYLQRKARELAGQHPRTMFAVVLVQFQCVKADLVVVKDSQDIVRVE